MTDKRARLLVQGGVDGLISTGDAVVLDALLASDPGARRLKAELEETGAILARMAFVEPPPGLRPSIMGLVYGEGRGHRRANVGFGGSFRASFALGAMSGSLLAGAALLFFFFAVPPQSTASLQDAAGAMLPKVPEPEADGTVYGRPVSTSAASGEVAHWNASGFTVVRVRLTPASAVEVRLRFTRGDIELTGIHGLSGEAPDETRVAGGEASFRLTRPVDITVPFQTHSGFRKPVLVQVVDRDKVVWEEPVYVSK